jgi:hypothetical protein
VEEGVFAIPLFLGAAHVHCNRRQEAVAFFPNDGGVDIAGLPQGTLVIAKSYNARFGLHGSPNFSLFNGLYIHRWHDLT